MSTLNNQDNQKKVAFYTLGCKLNYAETSMISRKFEERGFKKVSFDSQADVFVINTCSVTQMADKKCRQVIKKATGKGSKVIVIGCYSQLKPDEIAAIEGVDVVLGTKEKFKVVDHAENLFNGISEKVISCEISEVGQFESSFSVADRTRAFLKVQDGCDYSCTYCTIPMARGKSRNDNIRSIVEQAEIIASKGIKEIVLTGVNIGDFGRSTGEEFLDLIKHLDSVKNIERYRISSIEPNLLTDEIITFIYQSGHFAPHFHIPLQSGSDKILAAMRRRYSRNVFESRIKSIKSFAPDSCIGADVIVGFPGETDDDFSDTFAFIQSLDISYLHVFPFSERPNTPAFLMKGKVQDSIKDRRCKALIELSELKRKEFYLKNQGKHEKVIFESRNINGQMHGFTSNYIKAEIPYNKELIGKIVRVNLKTVNKDGNFEVENLD